MIKACYEVFREIDQALARQRELDYELLNVEQNRSYFFSQCQDVSWFDELSRRGFFKPEKVPGVNKEGAGIHSYWFPVDYLEKLSRQIKEGGHLEHAEKLLLIVKDVTEYKDANGEHIDNASVWYRFTTILNNLPKEYIHAFFTRHQVDFSKWLEVWLDTRHGRVIFCKDVASQLLPKFIKNSPSNQDVRLAEIIADVLLEVEFKDVDLASDKRIHKRKEAFLKQDAFWVLDGLIKDENLKVLGRYCSSDFLWKLLGRLKEMLQYNFFRTAHDFEHKECIYTLTISRREKADVRGIEQGSYEVVITKRTTAASEEEEKVRQVELTGIIDRQTFLTRFREKAKAALPADFDWGKHGQALLYLFASLDDDYTYIGMDSIRSGSIYLEKDALNTLIVALRDVLAGKFAVQKDDSRELLRSVFDKFLTDEYRFPILRRILLFFVADHYAEFGDYFQQLVKVQPDIFCGSRYQTELRELLKQNADAYKDDPARSFIEHATLLDNCLPFYMDKTEWSAQQKAYHQLYYLTALSAVPYFKKRVEDLMEIVGDTYKEPQARQIVWTGSGRTFFDVAWFLEHSNDEVVRNFDALKDEDGFGPEQKTVEATVEAFQKAVTEAPQKFCVDMDSFREARLICVVHLLYGLKDAWVKKQRLEWKKVLDFIRHYVVEGGRFKSPPDKTRFRSVYQYSVISAAADLISAGCNDDAWALSEEFYEDCEEVFSVLMKERYDCELPKKGDIQEVINTSFGRCVEAYIWFSLLKARTNDKAGRPRGFRSDVFDGLVDRKESATEAYTLFGRYIRQMLYLNKDWTLKKIGKFEDLPVKSLMWKGFFQGYIWSGEIYEILFQKMQVHYARAWKNQLDYDEVRKQIVEHAVIVYLYGVEGQGLEDKEGLIRCILDSDRADDLQAVALAFWSRAEKIVKEIQAGTANDPGLVQRRERVKEFWQWFFKERFSKLVASRLGVGTWDGFLAVLPRLIIVFEHINDGLCEQLKCITRFISDDTHFFIEYLDRYQDREDVARVGEVVLKLLETSLPMFVEENLTSIVRKLYANGFETQANAICEAYAVKGQHFLRKLWDDNNPKQE